MLKCHIYKCVIITLRGSGLIAIAVGRISSVFHLSTGSTLSLEALSRHTWWAFSNNCWGVAGEVEVLDYKCVFSFSYIKHSIYLIFLNVAYIICVYNMFYTCKWVIMTYHEYVPCEHQLICKTLFQESFIIAYSLWPSEARCDLHTLELMWLGHM